MFPTNVIIPVLNIPVVILLGCKEEKMDRKSYRNSSASKEFVLFWNVCVHVCLYFHIYTLFQHLFKVAAKISVKLWPCKH